jgi:ribose/xylose/arabinose/galactoside ABC-type transport system permease subunit
LGYAGGVVLIAVGVYLATITRISTNLLTGQTSTSNPDLGTGIVLIVIGVVIAGGIRLLNGGRRPR